MSANTNVHCGSNIVSTFETLPRCDAVSTLHILYIHNSVIVYCLRFSGLGKNGQCITYDAVNQAYIEARKRIRK